jgi:hypothetical protein
MKTNPKAIAIEKLNRFALDALRAAGVPDLRALKVVNMLDKKRRELADELVKQLETEAAK